MINAEKNLKVSELSPTQAWAVQAKMRHPRSFASAYLGKSERLREVAEYDLETLRRIGIAPEDFSKALMPIIDVAASAYYHDNQGPDATVKVGETLVVRAEHFRGLESCPFMMEGGNESKQSLWMDNAQKRLRQEHDACVGDLGSWNFFLRSALFNEEVLFSELVVHLIGEHHFFQGRMSRYRLDPLRTARILGLINDSVYEAEKSREMPFDKEFEDNEANVGIKYSYHNYDKIVIDLLEQEGLSGRAIIAIKGCINEGHIEEVLTLFCMAHDPEKWVKGGKQPDFHRILEEKGILQKVKDLLSQGLTRAMEIRAEEQDDRDASYLLKYCSKDLPDYIKEAAERIVGKTK